MKTVNDRNGNRMGEFDGRFVYSSSFEKIYWVEENEVFSMPQSNEYLPRGRMPAALIGKFIGGVATDLDGSIMFSL
jgi:hypothetical protein